MDIVSILIIAGIVILCLLPVLFRSFRRFDKTADNREARNSDVARDLRRRTTRLIEAAGSMGAASKRVKYPTPVPHPCITPPARRGRG